MSKAILPTTLSAASGLLLALALPAAGAGVAASAGTDTGTTTTPGAVPPPALSATVEQCVAATVQAGRSVTFTGQMETVPGAKRMAMEILVQARTPEEAGFHTLTAAGPGTWQRSEAGLKIYKYERQVTNLPAPAAYRAVVLYRWIGEHGRVIRRAERRTPVCRQPQARPRTAAGGGLSG